MEFAADRFAGTQYLLVPDGAGPFPAVLVTWYNAEDSAGLAEKARGTVDFGLQLVRRGFVTLCIGGEAGVLSPESLPAAEELGAVNMEYLIAEGIAHSHVPASRCVRASINHCATNQGPGDQKIWRAAECASKGDGGLPAGCRQAGSDAAWRNGRRSARRCGPVADRRTTARQSSSTILEGHGGGPDAAPCVTANSACR